MKVLYILHSTIMSGSMISFKNLIHGIVKKGIKPIIVYPRGEYNEVIKHFEEIGCHCYKSFVEVSVLPNNCILIETLIRSLKIFIFKILSFINIYVIVKRTNPDLIHTNTGVIHEGYFVSRMENIPHVWHIREYQTKDFNWRIFPTEKSFVKKLSKSNVVFITKDLQNYFRQLEDNANVIYNPIYCLSELKSVPIDKKEKYFLVANRISKEKGIEDIIVGLSEFLKVSGKYTLKIVGLGDPNYVNSLKDMCKTLDINDKVEFLGYVSDMHNLITNATSLLVGSYYEAFGRMTAEANLLGTYVIGRNTGGTKEILELTHGGNLFDDIKEIPMLIEKYINLSNYEKTTIQYKAKQVAIEFFTAENHCDKILDLYNKMTVNFNGRTKKRASKNHE